MTRYASAEDVEEAAKNWSNEILQCRDLGHSWVAHDAKHVRRLKYWSFSHRCTRCGTVRNREMSEEGQVYASWYTYPAGYQAKGMGRIVGPEKGLLRIATVTRTFEVTEVTGRAKVEDLPRSSKTPGSNLRAVR
jgi:hypothetical protein